MKVRTKFTLWITLSSLFAAVLFSIFVYNELLEEPHKLIKRELFDTGEAILNSTDLSANPPFLAEKTDYPLERYYVKLIGEDNRLLYASNLANHVDIPTADTQGYFTMTRTLAPDKVWIDPFEDDEEDDLLNDQVKFKVLQLHRKQGKAEMTLIIAKPLAMMSFELQELIQELFLYLLISTVLVILLSYYLAGRLLKPISEINTKIKAIRETSLDERIPLGKSQDELYTLAVSLNSMFDRLQHSFEKQKDFIASASHEMKIPLTVTMLGHEEMLSHELPENIREELSRQLVNLQRLNKLVKDLLDISHLEHKEFLERARVNLPLLIERVLEDFDEMLAAANIICKTEVERVEINADRDKMMRVFINLIDNAIKYNLPEGGHITIRVNKKNSLAEISIANTGREIPKEDIPHIFNQFYRVEKSRAIQYGGSGLGLTIVERIIELHGGTISVSSDEGKTTFTILMPIK